MTYSDFDHIWRKPKYRNPGADKVRRIGINPLDRRDFLTKARSVIRANKVLVNSIPYAATNQNKINRREVFMIVKSAGVLVVFLMSVLFVLANASAAAEGQKIRIGISSKSLGFLPTIVAEKKGFYKKYDLESEHIHISLAIAMNALGTGDLDYAVTLAQGVSAAIQGVPVKLVMMTQDKLTFFLLGRPEIKNVTDLKGKIIGISYPGSTTHLVATMMLRNFGLQEDKDFKMLPSGDEQGRLAALDAKRVQASIVSPPTDYFGEKMGFKVLLRASDQIKIPQNAVIVRDKKIQESRDQLKRMMKGTIEALQYIQTHKHEVTDIAAKWVGRDRESVDREINGYWSAYSSDGTMSDDVLRETINIGLQRAKLEKNIPISQVADTTILNEVKREMGIR